MEPEAVWDVNAARAVARAGCAAMGLDSEGMCLTRMAKNAVLALPAHDLMVRVSRPGRSDRRAVRVATIARAAGLAVLAPVLTDEPLTVRNHDVTFWPRCSPAGPSIDMEALGRTLRGLHELTTDLSALCSDDADLVATALASVRGRLRQLPADAVLPALVEQLDSIAGSAPLLGGLPPVVLHGDAHSGNLLIDAAGQQLLGDFDHVTLGPAGWDHVAVDVETRRFGRPSTWMASLRAGYGRDCSSDPGYELLVALRELKVATWLAGSAGTVAQQELRSRLAAWASGANATLRWRYV